MYVYSCIATKYYIGLYPNLYHTLLPIGPQTEHWLGRSMKYTL